MLHLVTGGAGYLGRQLIDRLLKVGERVRCIDIIEKPNLPPEVDYRKASILNRTKVKQSLKNVDVVHHLAAEVPITKSTNFFAVNTRGSIIVAEESVRENVEEFVYVSSSAIFGIPSTCPITADNDPEPVEAYGQSKLEGERLSKEILSKASIPSLVIRPRTLMGGGRLGIFQILFEWIDDNCTIYLPGDGKNIIQFLHISDFLNAYMILLNQGVFGTFNIGTDTFNTIKNDIERLITIVDSRSPVKLVHPSLSKTILWCVDKVGLSPLAPYHYKMFQESLYYDIQPLKELGWDPKFSNVETLKKSYEWYLNNKNELANRDTEKVGVHSNTIRQGVLKLVKFIS